VQIDTNYSSISKNNNATKPISLSVRMVAITRYMQRKKRNQEISRPYTRYPLHACPKIFNAISNKFVLYCVPVYQIYFDE